MNELVDNSPKALRPSELELIIDNLARKNDVLSRLTSDLQTGLNKINHYTEPQDAELTKAEALKPKDHEDTLVESLKMQLTIQEGYIQRLEFSLRHLRTIV